MTKHMFLDICHAVSAKNDDMEFSAKTTHITDPYAQNPPASDTTKHTYLGRTTAGVVDEEPLPGDPPPTDRVPRALFPHERSASPLAARRPLRLRPFDSSASPHPPPRRRARGTRATASNRRRPVTSSDGRAAASSGGRAAPSSGGRATTWSGGRGRRADLVAAAGGFGGDELSTRWSEASHGRRLERMRG